MTGWIQLTIEPVDGKAERVKSNIKSMKKGVKKERNLEVKEDGRVTARILGYDKITQGIALLDELEDLINRATVVSANDTTDSALGILFKHRTHEREHEDRSNDYQGFYLYGYYSGDEAKWGRDVEQHFYRELGFKAETGFRHENEKAWENGLNYTCPVCETWKGKPQSKPLVENHLLKEHYRLYEQEGKIEPAHISEVKPTESRWSH